MDKQLHFLCFTLNFLFLLLFKPTVWAQKWDTLAPVPENLTFPVVTVLDGRIHVVGGGGASGASKAHYEYNPATNAWSTRAELPYRAQQPAGAAVNGSIHHFGGGYPNSGTPLKDHYIYDPVTNSWSPGAELTAPRAIHSGVGLNGQLYTLGGQGMTKLVQVYDTATQSWIQKNDLPDNSFWYGAHVVANGKLYRFGGGGYTVPVKLAHEYDPGTDTWKAIPNLPHPVHGFEGAAIGSKIVLVGGYYNFVDTDEVLVYDTETQTYTPATALPRGRTYHSVVAIDSCIYVVGGNNAIDPDVGFQLLRLCTLPATGVLETGPYSRYPVSATYTEGRLRIQAPPVFAGQLLYLNLFNPEGQLVFSERLTANGSGYCETDPGILASSLYFIQILSEKGVLSGKLFIQR